MTNLGLKLGGCLETFTGMAGLGDLILTCTDNQSRNRRFGLAIGQGLSFDEAIKKIGSVVEGVKNTKQVMRLSKKHTIHMPICTSIYRVLYQNYSLTKATKDLFSHNPK
jgi:glycerol-3-phosphate dehydrogenase (NAD(P)+)